MGAVTAHVEQRRAFLITQAEAEKRWWKTSRRESKEIARLLSQKLGQLGFDYIFSVDGDKVRRFVKFDSVYISPDQYKYRVNSRKLPRGVTEVDMTDEKIIKGLECTLGKTVQYHLDETGLWFLIDRQSGLRNIPRYVEYRDVVNAMPNKSSQLAIPIGMGQNRHPTLIDFQRETTAHFLIGGTTGAGKTNAVHAIICTLLKRRPDEVRLILVDLKGIEFPQYSDCPHLMRPIVTNPGDVLELIQGLWEQVQDRMKMLRLERGVNHVREYNARRKPNERLPYIITVFDELAIVMLDRTLKHKAEIESYLARIASVGRASGIHLVLATQRPDKNVLTPLITANFPGRIALACASVYDSMTIIGNGEACFDEAVPPGRAVLSHGRFRMPFQVAFIRDDLRRSIIDDAEGGRFGVQQMTHDVTIDELAHYGLENFSGNFAIQKLWSQFRHRGITRDEIQELAKIYSVEQFYMEDGEYKLTQTGKRKAWMITKVLGGPQERAEDIKRAAVSCEILDTKESPEQPAQEKSEDDDEYQHFCKRVRGEIEGVPNVP